jgi:hypothetical protein
VDVAAAFTGNAVLMLAVASIGAAIIALLMVARRCRR